MEDPERYNKTLRGLAEGTLKGRKGDESKDKNTCVKKKFKHKEGTKEEGRENIKKKAEQNVSDALLTTYTHQRKKRPYRMPSPYTSPVTGARRILALSMGRRLNK